jgi:hypothetical protein
MVVTLEAVVVQEIIIAPQEATPVHHLTAPMEIIAGTTTLTTGTEITMVVTPL